MEQRLFLDVFAGKKIEVPCAYVVGAKDWGTYQEPGAIERMMSGELCADFRRMTQIESAGHWPQQEQPEQTANGILDLVRTVR